MQFPTIGGVVFLLSGVAALSAVALMNGGKKESPAAPAAASVAPSTDAPEGAVVFSVPDMHCEFACAPKVRETLAAVPGVEKVETDVEKQTATIVTGNGFDAGKALAALDEAGYSSEQVSR